ncbi:MAG: 1-acyl-sn-glycerol-3-phosphate acyltransferase [Anaerovibrio sp.]|uniref:lysophospholipid acyltransferase family protein n=1 Tax=Anaerovibrio sp. TaxID=1872532 RepID=UPI0025D94F83|nr:lysophospholipid acyltransferase family protein [Anaerovibrio sp.]MCR5176357.1 1-acyl-sn-glycerol-3-phosphate acyltransferase [Anaerovibrio sp.]
MFYSILKFILTILFGILFRPRVVGRENVPLEGGMIMAANHLSNWDPPVVGTYMPRPVAYMAKEELFSPAIAGVIIRNLYAFPVKRGAADRGAIKTALGILKQGLCLGVFPEGTRSKDGKTHKAESGVALLAAMGKVPVVPTAIIGTNKIFQNGGFLPRLQIIFGEPVYFEGKHNDKEELANFSKKIMDKIDNLIKINSQY